MFKYVLLYSQHDDDDDVDDDNNNSIQFFIYLRVGLNSRWPITESARNIKQTIH
jgi:hypothetical protein